MIEIALGFEAITCNSCAIAFALPHKVIGDMRRDHRSFYCPNGHRLHFPGRSDVEELKAQLDREKLIALEQRQRAINAEASRDRFRRDRNKAQMERERIEHRIECGVCLKCKRSFKQVRAHMLRMHPKSKS